VAEEDAEADDEADEEEVDPVDADELELELDEQPATARSVKATAPETPVSRRRRLRRCERFMAPSLRSPGITEVDGT
jgi:hypothetical protein